MGDRELIAAHLAAALIRTEAGGALRANSPNGAVKLYYECLDALSAAEKDRPKAPRSTDSVPDR